MLRKYHVTLTPEERSELDGMTRRGRSAARTLVRAWVLLKCDEGGGGPAASDAEVADALECGVATVARVRQRFVEEGLAAAPTPRPSARVYERRLDGDGEARLVALACSNPPRGRDRWTLRLLADRMVVLGHVDDDRLSYETVRRVLKKRVEALAAADMVHPARAGLRVRRGDGGRAGGVQASGRPAASAGLHGRGRASS